MFLAHQFCPRRCWSGNTGCEQTCIGLAQL